MIYKFCLYITNNVNSNIMKFKVNNKKEKVLFKQKISKSFIATLITKHFFNQIIIWIYFS